MSTGGKEQQPLKYDKLSQSVVESFETTNYVFYKKKGEWDPPKSIPS